MSFINKRPNYLVCTCMEIMYQQVVASIKNGENTLCKLSDNLGVGTGCSSCVEDVESILDEELKANIK